MTGSGMVGRVVERDVLAGAGFEAAHGQPSAVVLHGEPGVGKTRLVTEAAEGVAATHEVMWVRFPRFSSSATAFLPVAQALSRWATTASDADRVAVFADTGDLAAIMPELGPSRPVDGGRLTSLLTTVIHRIGQVRPLVLVADDLQWADSSSLDLLAFLIAGFGPRQQLAILATYRDTELGEGHRFNEWIADMRRMPGVTVRGVGRLDRGDTADLIHALTGGASAGLGRPDADAIYERSLGNPYLTELLAADPAAGGSSLEEALLASWHRLEETGRTLTQILAVGGRPVPTEVLVDLAGRAGLPGGAALRGLGSARAAGLVLHDGDAVWFRHPLLSEVIADTVPAPVAAGWHEDYVRLLEGASGIPAQVRSSLLALHYQEAGQPTAAFTWSLAAAADAAAVHATAEESAHLQRACRLWDNVEEQVRTATGDRVALLERACLAALRAGQLTAAQELAQSATRFVDPVADRRRAAHLIYSLRIALNAKDTHQSELDRALTAHDLAQRGGPSEELALALSYRSDAELWCGVPEAEAHADEAIAVADRIGSPVALAHAHLVHSQFHNRSTEGTREALAAWETLRVHGGLMDWATSNVKVMNCLEGIGRYDAVVAHGLRVLADFAAAGAPVLGGPPGAITAHFLVRLGRWEEARAVIRTIVAHQQFPNFASYTRATAAQLSAHVGDLDAAHDHLARSYELKGTADPLGSHASVARVEVRWCSGDLAGALDGALTDIPRVAPFDPDHADELYLWGLRAIADLAGASHPPDRGGSAAAANLGRLDRARAVDAAQPDRPNDDDLHLTIATIIAAERARCTAGPDQIPRWRAARDAAAAASLLWESGWAGYQLGRALLAERGHRVEAADTLRIAYKAMTWLGAQPLAERIRSVAAQAHVPLDDPAAMEAAVGSAAREPGGLTGREREVLAQIVKGHTYAEIARDLYISRKTVSVHVSNLLRKTGTTNRIDLVALIAAQGQPMSE